MIALPYRFVVWAWVVGALCILPVTSPPASAHEGRPIVAELVLATDGAAVLTLNDDAAGLADLAGAGKNVDLSTMPPEARLRAVMPNIIRGIRLLSDKGPVVVRFESLELADEGGGVSANIRLRGKVPPGATQLTWGLDPSLGESVIRVRRDGEEEPYAAVFVRPGETTPPLELDQAGKQSWGSVFVDYLFVGFDHIVPKGLDHILFVVGLFLLSTRLSPLLWQVTMFTLAHSVTLALGLLDIIRLPGEIVEPLIAASILYVAIDNLRGPDLGRARTAIVFAFGLLHGLGFAGVLSEYGLPPGQFVPALIAFNIGVEVGQIAVIALCFLAVGFWFGQRSWYRAVVVIPGSLVIGAIAAYWAVERTGLLS